MSARRRRTRTPSAKAKPEKRPSGKEDVAQDTVEKEDTKKSITGWRLWLFRGIALSLPFLLLLLVEAGLWIGGYGFEPNALLRKEIAGEEVYCSNLKFGWRFFPRRIAREFEPFIFPAEKGANTYRIFILGASAAQGTPDVSYSFGRFLAVMLESRYPPVKFEVITAAMPAINSHVVVPIARECAGCDGEMFIVYLGNNEVVGPYGAGTIFSGISSNIRLIRAGIWLRGSRLGQLLVNALEGVSGSKGRPRTWRGMEMFLANQVPAEDERLAAVYGHFERNLRDICRTAQEAGIVTLLSTVGCNLKDSPPFSSGHRADLAAEEEKKWEAIYQKEWTGSRRGSGGRRLVFMRKPVRLTRGMLT